MKLRLPLFVIVVAFMFLMGFVPKLFAFNLLTDIDTQTTWTLGQVASAGTSIDLKNGQYDASEFAQVFNYRMLSGWYGGIEIPQSDGTMKLTDSAKLGLNLGYFLKNFVNTPPAILTNLVIGPAIGGNLATSPRVIQYFADINYQFGK
jgi:hypothetical protein